MSIYIKKSIYDILSKSLNMSEKGNKAKFEKLKAAVIAILEKKEKADDKEEVKKAALYFAKDEYRYSYLEKSVNGEWIEKAGYGVGTVRIWKGKKYKKVATNPVKWVRVFDKHTRGAASSMGRYIAQVKRCSSVDELYQFCMKQRSLFQDENGVDLPIMDKLRAAIDEQGGKIESGKTGKEPEKSRNPFNMKDMSYSITVRNGIEEYKKQKKIMNWDLENEKKKIEKEYDFSDMSEEKKNNFLKPKFENLENQFKAAKDNVEYIKKMLVQFSDKDGVNNIISKMKNAGIYEEVMGKSNKEPESKEKTFELEKEDFQNAETMSEKFKLLGLKKGQKVEYDGETYTVDAIAGTNHDKGKFQMSILQWDAQGNISKRKYITALNFDKVKPIENKESEQEKHQNRSDAMKGNQNAYKGKPIEKAIEKYANDKKLKSTVDKISSADFVSTDLRKYFMNGIYHEDGYDIATDGRILSMMKSDYSKDDEGEITVTDKLLKIAEKELKKLNKELLLAEAKLKEAKKEAKQKGRGSNYYLEFENNVRKIKEEIDTIEKEKETGHIAGHFPAYKRVIPSLGNSKLDNIKGFEDFDNILRVAKVAAAYIKEKDDNNTVVKVGDKYFKPELLEKVVAMAKKYGLNEILSDSERENGPVEFKGENGSVVIMPINPDESNIFDSETGEVSSQKNYDKQQIEDFMNGNAELNTKDEERNAKREEKLSRTASEETKQSLSEDVPEGITPANYKAYIDFGAKQYTKWGYDMNDPRNQKQLKEQIKEIAQQIENKDFSIIDSLENKDNVFTRMIWTYQTGGIAPGNTREETKNNVERYFGPEATKKHKEELESKRIQVEKERAENDKRILTNKVKSIFDKSHVNYGQLSSEDAREKLTEYLSTLPSNRQESAIKRLSKDLIRYQKDGKDKVSYTLDYIIDSIKDGRTLDDIKRTYRDIRSKPLVSFAEWYINNKLGIQKSVLLDDYAEFIDINLDEDYETDNEEFDDYEDYDASQPELFNSISYKVGNVLDDLYCC